MELTHNSRVAVIGGGPAGSFSAYYLLDFAKRIGLTGLHVDIYEPKDFAYMGAKGCNHCGGLVSESMLQLLSMEGIVVPSDTIMNTIDSYKMHTQDGTVVIELPLAQMRIATVYRGGGPKLRGKVDDIPPGDLPKASFDGYLLDLACSHGANHILERVTNLSWQDGLPHVTTKAGTHNTYDLLVGAVGVNGGGMKLFENWDFGYQPPKTVKAFVGEYRIGRENVERYIGGAMNVFLLNIPGLKFAALIPKGPFVTLCMQGDISHELINNFIDHSVVRRCFPPGWEPPSNQCHCLPKCNIGEPLRYYSDRVVLVGDSGVSRLYKDGIGAAFQTGRACAATAIFFGVRKEDFEKYYQPACDRIKYDNLLGRYVFDMIEIPKKVGFLRRAILSMARREQKRAGPQRPMSMFLWNSFTGSATYKKILWDSIHPRFVLRFTWELIKAMFQRKPTPVVKSTLS